MGTSLRAYTRLRMRTSIGCPRFAFAAAEAIIAAPGIVLPSSSATGSSRAPEALRTGRGSAVSARILRKRRLPYAMQRREAAVAACAARPYVTW